MQPAGFKPAIPASDLPQTPALDPSATGTGWDSISGRQTIASRYRDYAIPDPHVAVRVLMIFIQFAVTARYKQTV